MSKTVRRVDHVITRLMGGGAQENTVLTCRGLSRRDHFDVRLIHGPNQGAGDLSHWAERWNLRRRTVTNLVRPINPRRDVQAFLQLVKLFREDPPDVVHTHSSKAGVLGRWAASLVGVPAVVHTVHGMSFHPAQSPAVRWTFKLIEQLSAQLTTELQAVCPDMVSRSRAGNLEPRQGFRTVASGMELEQFLSVPARHSPEHQQARAKLARQEGDTVAVKIARLVPLKGQHFVLEALAQLDDPALTVVFLGGGPKLRELKARARNLGVYNHVKFEGQVPQEEIPEYLTGADLVLHTSLREGLPRVIPQAMAAGRPPISFALDGAPDLIRNRENGYLLDPPGAASLASVLNEVLDDPGSLESLAEQARRTPLPDYDWRVMADTVAQSYHELLGAA